MNKKQTNKHCYESASVLTQQTKYQQSVRTLKKKCFSFRVALLPPALTHEQCRKDMCCAFGGRAGKQNITPALGQRIRKWAQPTWNADVVSHPVT